ncbi:hypothetical protein [Streptomyces sp. NBC_01198]|uniref:hypothetical protein n=1 Tax=Streptomyces sp. NBC_01198 TaxID=2903769 RepID=UPI002E0EBB40|nr:hypothetical protein OG702_00390 [Streptomyces sp. NBC_01198]
MSPDIHDARTLEPRRMRRRILACAIAVITGSGALLATGSNADAATAGIVFSPDVISGGQSSTATVALAAVSSSPTVLSLENFAPGILHIPATVTVPAGSLNTTFPLTAGPLTSGAGEMCVEAEPGDLVGCLFVNVVGGPTLNEVTFANSPVPGADTDTGQVSFTDPTPGATVTLSSSNPSAAAVPATVTLPDGARTATFTATTGTVTTATSVTVTATSGAVSQHITLIVTPRPGAAGSDVVHITKARWNKGIETIEAASTNSRATLYLGDDPTSQSTLTNQGNGTFKTQFAQVNRPTQIAVFSSFGGNATATVTQ